MGIAVGLLLSEGKLSLDDKTADLFFDKIGDVSLPPELREQTVRDMLTMSTAGTCDNWFKSSDTDRTHLYFSGRTKNRLPGTLWHYDSSGSQVLSSLVERLSGMPLLEYLREKLFSHTGGFESAEILKAPNGDSWGDSAMICTPRDMAIFATLLMRGGR